MTPNRSSLSARAEKDLALQYQWYLKEADFEVAEEYLTAAFSTICKIESMPGIGRKRRFRDQPLQNLRSRVLIRPFDAHLIFYRDTANGIEIFRVMGGARDLPQRLVEEPKGSDGSETV